MITTRRFIAILSLCGLFLLLPAVRLLATQDRVVILHFNDLHGQIDVLAKIAAIKAAELKENPDVFLISAGDQFSGNPIVDQYEPKGEPVLQLLNSAGLDILALGNHEFDFGQDVLKSFIERADFKSGILCANLVVEQGILPQPPPTTVIKTSKGVEIALLGLIQVSKSNGLPDTHPDRVKGIRFLDPLKTAEKFRHFGNQYPVFIAVSHLGFEGDVELAAAMPELDLIIGGHSHTTVKDGQVHNGVLVTQAGSRGRYLGRIELTLENGKLTGKKASLIDLRTVTNEIPELRTMIDAFNDNPQMNRILLQSPVSLEGKDEIGSFICDALRAETGADVAITNNGGIRRDTLPAEIRLRTVFEVDPFGNQVVLLAMSAAEIRDLIRSSFNGEIDLQISGMAYEVITRASGGVDRINLLDTAGQPVDETRDYRVAMNSYIVSSYRFTHRDPGQALSRTSAECLIAHLEKKPDLTVYKKLVRAVVK
jgi:2',3'-cyclic-nucleotide 2'-phosphodiesterase (5'-nucleotidase family)